MSPALVGGFFTTEPPGKPPTQFSKPNTESDLSFFKVLGNILTAFISPEIAQHPLLEQRFITIPLLHANEFHR